MPVSSPIEQPSQRRHRIPVVLVPLLAAGSVLAAPVSAQEREQVVAGVLGTPAPTESCNLDDFAAVPDGTAQLYSIASEASEARYVSEEELSGVGANTAIGRTNAFIGQIGFDEAGMPLACSRFDVDLRTLTSDSARRDNYLYSNTLETETYPLATFILTSVDGLDGPLVEGEETAITLIGNLTLHGVTNLVAWDAMVTLNGDTITGSAETAFRMPEYNITPPIVGMVISIDETIKLQVDITAKLAG
jgi:polyisoprenoid-binding protein YceI